MVIGLLSGLICGLVVAWFFVSGLKLWPARSRMTAAVAAVAGGILGSSWARTAGDVTVDGPGVGIGDIAVPFWGAVLMATAALVTLRLGSVLRAGQLKSRASERRRSSALTLS